MSKPMIDSMFLGIFAGMSSCFVALLLNYKLAHNQDVDHDTAIALAKTCMYLLTTSLICLGAVLDMAIGSLAISVYTLFGMFAFVVADEIVSSTFSGRLASEAE